MASPDDPSLRPLFDELKARQIAFFEHRLVSDEAAREWRSNLESGYRALLATPLGELAPAGAWVRAVDRVLSEKGIDGGAGPVMRRAVPASIAWLRGDERKLGAYVPAGARAAIEKLLARPGLIPSRLVREVVEHDAMEEVMRDVLYEVLVEFSDKVNPFFAEWGLPALLKRVMPLGAGTMIKALEGVKAEFQGRLEPEIRRFLHGVTRRALHRTANVLVERGDRPPFIVVRQRFARWLYEQRAGELLCGIDDEGARLAQRIGEEVTRHTLAMEEVKELRANVLRAFSAEHEARPLGEVLASYGIDYEPDFDTLSAASWPLMVAALKSEAVRGWFASLVGEFYDGLGRG